MYVRHPQDQTSTPYVSFSRYTRRQSLCTLHSAHLAGVYTLFSSVLASNHPVLFIPQYQPRLPIPTRLGAVHRKALYGTVTSVICNASTSRSVFFWRYFSLFLFAAPPRPFDFFFSFLYFFLSRSLSFPFFLQSCCSSSSCTTFFFIVGCLVVLVCS